MDDASGTPVPTLHDSRLPYGTICGNAKEIASAIADAAISPALMRFLLKLHAQSFGNAGWQQRTGHAEPGLTGPADIAFWRSELGWTRQRVWDIRQKAVALGFALLIPNEDDPQHARLRWNLDLATWLPLQDEYRRARYARPGAGRKSNGVQEIKRSTEKSNVVQAPPEKKSNVVQNVIKRSTHAGLEAAPAAASGEPLRKEERIRKKGTEANASGANVVAPLALPATPKAPDPTAAKPRTPRPRKLTDAQLEVHRSEQAYLSEVLTALKDVIAFKGKLPHEEGERREAKWFLTAGPDGARAPVEHIAACYRILKGDPFLRGRPVGVRKLTEHYAEFTRDAAAFRAAHAPKDSKPTNGYAPKPEPPKQRFISVVGRTWEDER